MTLTAARSAPPASSAAEHRPTSRRRFRIVVALTSLTGLAIVAQAVIAGAFINKDGQDSLVTLHGVVADVTWGLALVNAVASVLTFRRRNLRFVVGAGALFALTLAQTGIGHLITDEGMDGLVVVHVPLAVLIFGLATWLIIQLPRLTRRQLSP